MAMNFGWLGSIFNARAERKARKNIEAQRKKNQDWYDRRYNEDATQKADAQALLARTEQMLKDRTKRAAGAQAVMGGTDESLAADKAASMQAMANTMTGIAVNADKQKAQIEQAYKEKDDAYQNAINQSIRNKAKHVGAAVSGGIQAVADYFDPS